MADEDDTPYHGQEDINDKLVLDLAWERQQKKVRPCRLVHLSRSGAVGWAIAKR